MYDIPGRLRFLNVAQRLKLEGLLTEPDACQEEKLNNVSFKENETFLGEDVTRLETKCKPNPPKTILVLNFFKT